MAERDVRQWLRERRRAHDLTQEALAQLIGCAPATIRRIESGARRPSRQVAELLARALVIAPEEHALFIALLRGIAPAAVSEAPAQSRRDAPELTGIALHPTLPHQPRPFIGRVRELTMLAALLAESDTRVVTIVAPGGMGKTRLALAALAQAQGAPRFANGTVYVSLTALVAAAQLETTLAAALNLPLTTTAPASRSTRHQILDYLREKQLLLLLDSCEQQREGVADLVMALLAEAPGVTLLLTSRERLGLRAERPFVLGGMDPEGEGRALFAASVRAMDPTFTLDAASEPLVAAICAQVGGMPLAIELAAGWSDTLSLAELAAELGRSSDVLATQARDVPARQRSVRVICDETWARLAPEEQVIFAQMAVFRGGCTRWALQAVTGASLAQIQVLIMKALLRYDPERERYSIHELLRQYAAERLADDAVADAAAHERHAGYYLTALATGEADLLGAGQVAGLRMIGRDLENVYTAWGWATDHQCTDLLLGAAYSLGLFYEWQGYYGEGFAAFQHASDALATQHDARLASALTLAWCGTFARLLGDLANSTRHVQRALQLVEAEPRADPAVARMSAYALLQLGHLQLRGETIQAQQTFTHSLTNARACGDEWLVAAALNGLGLVFEVLSQYAEAEAHWQESLRINRRLGAPLGIATVLAALNAIARYQGQIEESIRLAQESYDLCLSMGNQAMIATGSLYLSRALHWGDDLPRAEGLLRAAAQIFSNLGDPSGLAETLYQRGALYAQSGRYAEAEADLHRAAALAIRLADKGCEGKSIWLLACCALGRRDLDVAEHNADEAIALLEQVQAMDWVARAHTSAAHVAHLRGQPGRAWAHIALALRLSLRHRSYMALMFALRPAALLTGDSGAIEQAIELGELARQLTYGRWAEDLCYTQLDALAAQLPAEVAAAARERGLQRDPWLVAQEVLAGLEANKATECRL